jgi:hypothetical protein
MNHSQISHLFFSENRKNRKSSNIFIDGNIIYSYGHHFPLAKEIEHKGQKYLFVNTYSYSNSTSKHQNHLRRAINKDLYLKVFYVDFLRGYYGKFDFELSKEFLSLFFERENEKIKNYLFDHNKAKSSLEYWNNFQDNFSLLINLKAEFPELCFDTDILQATQKDFEKVLFLQQASKVKAEKREQRKKEKIEKIEREQKEKLILWLEGKYNGQLYYLPETYLRLNGDKIETTRGASVDLNAALKLHNLLINKKGLGEKINGYTVTSVTLDFVQIGCHQISWHVINEFLTKNNLV